MTVATIGSPRTLVIGMFGCLALVMRPLLPPSLLPLALLFAALFVVGALSPVADVSMDTSRASTALALSAGVGAFVVVRLVATSYGHPRVSHPFVAVALLAAIAEEAFFRRYL